MADSVVPDTLSAGDPVLVARRHKAARKGLPSRKNLEILARVWLEQSQTLWPQLVAAGTVPKLSDASVRGLAAAFEARFVAGKVDAFPVPSATRPWKALGLSYLRYSDDNSNPRSLDDQLAKQIRFAHNEGRFIPWEYVVADASVTGRTQLRRGYRLAKEAMESLADPVKPDTLYFDDFSRASRNSIESFRLARLMERHRRRLIGVSDGFSLGHEGTELLLGTAAMFNEWFVRQLRQKVLRGMKGEAPRAISLGKVRFGFKLAPARDSDGRPILRDLGSGMQRNTMTPVIDDEAMPLVLQAAHWFVDDYRSYKWIAMQFNGRRAAGRSNWTGSEIMKMLRCPMYIGVRIYNKSKTELDGCDLLPET